MVHTDLHTAFDTVRPVLLLTSREGNHGIKMCQRSSGKMLTKAINVGAAAAAAGWRGGGNPTEPGSVKTFL